MFSSFSLRDKVLLLMTTITALTLGLFLMVATSIFKSDKSAEVSYNSAAVARGLATQARIEIDAIIGNLKPVVQGFDFQTNQLNANSTAFAQSLSEIQHLTLYRKNAQNQYVKVISVPADTPDPTPANLIKFEQVAAEGVGIEALPGAIKPSLVLAARFGAQTSSMHLIAVAVLPKLKFVEAVQAPSNYANVVLGQGGNILFANANLKLESLPAFSQWKYIQDLITNNSPPGSAEVTPDGSTEPLLLAYAPVGLGRTMVLSFIPKSEAMVAVKLLLTKSLALFFGLLCLTVAIGVWSSKQITSALSRLMEASRELATGKFDVQIQVNSRDEIGTLSESFMTMAKQLAWYVVQVAEKASLEAELNTARTVQETLFPPETSRLDQLDISGRYEPASQCGGDWWYYSRVGDKIFMWIGDATGHGVSAALLTSAARSAASIIEMFPSITPGQALQMLNRAIHETSKGKLLMTFFVGSYDINTHEYVYANASHEPPWLFKASGGQASKKSLVPLNEVNNPRLGEGPDNVYNEGRVTIEPGDRIFFYTDGVSELKNDKGEVWGERKFLKAVMGALNATPEVKDVATQIQTEINGYRNGAKLEDDVTFFVCKVRDAA